MEICIYQKQVSGLSAFPGHFHEGALFDKHLRAKEKTDGRRGEQSAQAYWEPNHKLINHQVSFHIQVFIFYFMREQ